jgi:ferredoxin
VGKKVVIETDECSGCESCVELCPEIFEFDEEEEKAHVKLPEVGDEECIEEAISKGCPQKTILEHWMIWPLRLHKNTKNTILPNTDLFQVL